MSRMSIYVIIFTKPLYTHTNTYVRIYIQHIFKYIKYIHTYIHAYACMYLFSFRFNVYVCLGLLFILFVFMWGGGGFVCVFSLFVCGGLLLGLLLGFLFVFVFCCCFSFVCLFFVGFLLVHNNVLVTNLFINIAFDLSNANIDNWFVF